ncbi:MAG: FecR domain-containing protein [Deltaproteobacteria bacterium]|nr:FecR domain-containing protein [Deltaproteobacteria bacterium]MBW2577646.1 FecR domain-containing protein [Deltaproteobacteria bacterium]MBW2691504.1 FecR domain-containing protein [Deltaproteobacteria bacterium]
MIDIAYKKMRTGGLALGLAALLWSGAPAVFADEVAGHVTASIESGLDGPITEGEHVRLGEGDACSILLDDDAVVELCGETSVVFKRDRDSNRRIVSLDSGEIRIVVEPREFEERIEIHTPAVIATLLGTIVHVTVDPNTGETTITSAQSKVSVRSDESAVRGTTVLTAGEQVTVEPGDAPPADPKRLDPEEVSALGGCLVNFHTAAADRDSRGSGERATGRLTAFDAANAGSLTRAPSSDRPGESPRDEPGDPLTGQEDVCVATDCEPHENPQGPTRLRSF